VRLTYEWDGDQRSFECADNVDSALTSNLILRGATYPHLPFVTDVRVILDVGANCGATATWFSHLYPEATIYAFEPAAEPYKLLRANTDQFDNVRAVNAGLYDADDERDLYHGADDSITGSILRRWDTAEDSEPIELRSAIGWYREAGLDRLDVLKVDTEGCEVPIFESLIELVPQVKVVYLEYHSEDDRHRLDELLGPTHTIFFGRIIGGEGELAYVAKSLMPAPGAIDLKSFFKQLIPV
jgi:FkbM family methyltransferase